MKMTSAVAGALALGLIGSAQAEQYVANGEFTELTNGLGQIDNNTTAVGWTSNNYNFVFSDGSVAVPGSHGGLSLWTASNGGVNSWNGLAASGGNFAALDGKSDTGPVTQTVTGLTTGKTYDLTFDYAFSQQYGFTGATTQSLAVTIAGTPWRSGNVSIASEGFSGWTVAEAPFTATSPSEALSFLAAASGGPPFALVSNVSVSGVPELSTWVMMIAGFVSLGFAGYRRKKDRNVA